MADNKLLQRREADENFLAEDDPLAELARIVGFDLKPTPAQAAVSARRDPEFDLEDELLREFEQYAAPEPMAGFDPPIEQSASSFAVAEASVAEDMAYSPVEAARYEAPEPVAFVQPVAVVEKTAPMEAVRPVSHPVFDLEDEILREFAAFDARRDTAQPVAPVEDALAESPVWQDADGHAVIAPVSNADDAEFAHDAAVAADAGVDDVPSFEPEVESPEVEPVYATVVSTGEAEELSEALENSELTALGQDFWSQPQAGTQAAFDSEPVLSVDSTARQAAFAATERAEPWFGNEPSTQEAPVDSYQEASVVAPIAEMPRFEPVQAAAVEPVQEPARAVYSDYGLDDLLSEVEKFPIPELGARWGVQAAPAAADDIVEPPRVTLAEQASFAAVAEPYVEEIEAFEPTYLPEPAAVAHVEPLVDVAPVGEVEPVAEIEPVTASAVVSHLEAATDPFDDGAFELDMGDIELDLSEIEPMEAGQFDASNSALSALAEAEVESAAEVAYAPGYAAKAASAVEQEDYSSLPFDPSQIAGEEDAVEALADMDVPEPPVHDVEDKPATPVDYDIDIDAEMAQMFSRPVGDGAEAGAPVLRSGLSNGADATWKADMAASGQNSAALELDEFERALEEDFRRSLSENRDGGNPDRVALTPAYQPEQPRRSRTAMVALAASVAVIALLGAGGIYAFVSGDSKIMATSGEPKIILADKDPVKEVPLDKGGQTVPNQNKAVYDRVAGETADVAKQESLVSSTEEPVDVVQKTLMPEGLPEDEDAAVTATTDTSDPRLLPEGADTNVTTSNKVVSGVAPRKVRTMVVKADGTLVAREELAPETKNVVKTDAEIAKAAEKSAQDAANKPASTNDEIAKVIEDVPERLSAEEPVTKNDTKTADQAAVKETQPVVDTKPVDEAVADTAVVTPEVKPEQTVAESVTAEENSADPVVDAKPVDVAALPETDVKPADVKTKEVNRSVEINNADAIKEAASADVADQVADAPVRVVKTTKIKANTPIPENRPVDQPVNVVGTVTDQGNVRNDAEAPQEVAAIDQQETKPVVNEALPAGAYVIQIASLPSAAEAQSSYNKLSNKFSSVIAGRGVDIRKAQIKNKGTYYRVRIPAGSKQEALELCNRYKQAGGSCLVSK